MKDSDCLCPPLLFFAGIHLIELATIFFITVIEIKRAIDQIRGKLTAIAIVEFFRTTSPKDSIALNMRQRHDVRKALKSNTTNSLTAILGKYSELDHAVDLGVVPAVGERVSWLLESVC